MNPTLGAILLLSLSLPLIIYINFVPLLQQFMARCCLPGVKDKSEFDFIVVGAGSTGSVVAGRLAEHGHQVLLLEAGGPANWLMTIPGLVLMFQLTQYDWQYQTVTQKHAPFGILKGKCDPKLIHLESNNKLKYLKIMHDAYLFSGNKVSFS